jgi:putative membrane protein
MKKILFLSLIILSYNGKAQEPDDDAPTFIVNMADARLMDREEGRLAAGYGSTQEIRDYGTLMVKDQETLYAELKQLAASKNITLPGSISEKKSKALEKLGTFRGKKFDRKFLKMMKIDHKRDVRRFEKATAFDDAATKAFAQKYLSMIQRHLEAVKKLQDKK